MVIDLGKMENLSGFRYLPSQHHHSGIISQHQCSVSADNQRWEVVDRGEYQIAIIGRYDRLSTFNR